MTASWKGIDVVLNLCDYLTRNRFNDDVNSEQNRSAIVPASGKWVDILVLAAASSEIVMKAPMDSSVPTEPTLYDEARLRVVDHMSLLDRLAHWRFRDPNVADEALLYVLKALEANNWQKIKMFKGESSFSTYLSHVTLRLLEDFSRSKFGRKRIPNWIQTQGNLWEKIFQLLCIERMRRVDVIEMLATSNSTHEIRYIIEEAIETILSRVPDCGNRRGEMVSTDFSDSDGRPTDVHLRNFISPEDLVEACQRVSIIEAIGHCLTSDTETEKADIPMEEKIRRLVGNVQIHLRLTKEDRLLLKMVYQDGLSTSAAGRLLGLGTDQVHGRLRRLLAKIREAFKKTGFDQELRLLLNESV